MKFYSNETITEGEILPNVWIWNGEFKPCNRAVSKHTVFMVKLPWWTRQPIIDCRGRHDATCQLTFIMDHMEGYIEHYEWRWLPIEERD